MLSSSYNCDGAVKNNHRDKHLSPTFKATREYSKEDNCLIKFKIVFDTEFSYIVNSYLEMFLFLGYDLAC